jgi:beta-glucosidase
MKMIKKLFIWSLFFIAPLWTSSLLQAQNSLKLTSANIKQLIASMTLQEKARLVVGTGMFFELPDSIIKKMPGGRSPFGPPPDADTTYNMMINKVRKLVPGAAGTSAELSRSGITPMVVSDGPAGVRINPTRKNDQQTYYCTAFPVGTTLASTWNLELIQKLGEAYGNEVKEYGIDILLGPGMNIQRNPLCGRNFEYYSEDPLVAGKMSAAMVKGIQSQGVGTSIKHFAANNQETNRNSVNTIVSERALREIYLEGFRIAVQEAQPWTVMSSYNLINGTYTSESADLLTNILRNDWGFKGYVMTDWMGGKDAIAQMIAGNDLLMPGSSDQYKKIVEAVKGGKLEEKILDRNVEKLLNIVVETPRFKNYKYSNKPDLKTHGELTRQVATEGIVLLKNEKSALPLSKNIQKVAAFGNASYEVIVGGTGSGNVNRAYSVSPIEGLKNGGYKIDEMLSNTYAAYIKKAKDSQPKSNFFMMMGLGSNPVAEMPVDADLAGKMADASDVALITIGRNAGEGADRKVEDDFNLTKTEKSNLEIISQAFQAKGKKTIVVLNIGGVIETASWKNIPDAILLAWQPGQEAGNSITDILSGKVNPSGKLAVSFPVNYSDVPSYKSFPGIELEQPKMEKNEGPGGGFGRSKPAKVIYEEGIYVGYRYYNTFNVKTSYEFGYGLSYTNFAFSALKLSSATFKDEIKVTVDVKNAGNTAGKQVVQLYLAAPSVKLDKPESELKGFAKTKLLQPGESETVSFTINTRNLASFDPSVSAWIAEAGKYTVKIGASCSDIKQTAVFELGKEISVKTESRSLIPSEKIAELKPIRK